MRRARLRILHTADIHLGENLEAEAAMDGFRAVLRYAAEEPLDVMIVAGDLFDGGAAAHEYFDFALGELDRLPVPVVLLPGNHDPCDEGSVYLEKAAALPASYPGVQLITDPDGELLCFPALGLNVWGRPIVEHSREFRPLENIPERQNGGWHVAIAHGLHVDSVDGSFNSSLIPGTAVVEAGWDYLALGHLHVFRDVSNRGAIACYSGAPGRQKANGVNAGCAALVELDPEAGVGVRRVELQHNVVYR